MEAYSLGQISIRRSLPKSIGLLIVASVFVAIGIWLVRGGAVGTKGTSTIFFGWVTVVFFGICSVLALFRLIFGSNTPVILSPTGFVDKRSFKREIPWSEISHVSVFSYRKTSMIRLQLAYDGIDRLELTWSATITRWLNKPFSLDGLYISSSDLDISFPELWDVTRRYVTEFCPHALAGDK